MPFKSDLKLLCFDGGGRRCLSSLLILQSMLLRLSEELFPNEPERAVHPYEHFDLIGGTGVGGLISILLARLRLSIDEALEEVYTILDGVYTDDDISPEDRVHKLRVMIMNILIKRDVPPDAKLLEDGPVESRCLGFVTVSLASNVGAKLCLKTYHSSKEPPIGITIMDAALATCASQPLFAPVSSGLSFRKRTYIAAGHVAPNPIRTLLAEALSIYGAESKATCILSIGSGQHGAVSLPSGKQKGNVQALLQNAAVDAKETAEEMSRQLGQLGVYFRLSVEQGLQQTEEKRSDLEWISAQTDEYLAGEEVRQVVESAVNVLQSGLGIVTLEELQRVSASKLIFKEEPMLASHYIRRQDPWNRIMESMSATGKNQRVIIVSGMGGCGKTQLMTEVIKEYKANHGISFKHVFFVDGSSQRSIEADLTAHIRLLSSRGANIDAEAARNFLRNPGNAEWMLAIDNVDLIGTELSDQLPRCNHGVILVTTRNETLGMLASKPEYHITLDIMTSDESTAVLMRCMSIATCTPDQRTSLERIAEKLGYLPVALSQAGYYMRETTCSAAEYLGLINQSLSQQMERPAQNRQNDCAYAAFDLTFKRLPPTIQDLSHILSYYHFTDFPLAAVVYAAKKSFAEDLYPFELRKEDHYEAIDVLKRIFMPTGSWSDSNLFEIVATMRKFSLASFTSTPLTRLARRHPLFHEWAYDRIPSERRSTLRHAACRLLACCWDSGPLYTYLVPQVDAVLTRPDANYLILNDKAVLAKILLENWLYPESRAIWQDIYSKLTAEHGPDNLQVAIAALELGASFQDDDLQQMEYFESEAVRIRRALLGEDHIDTLKALDALSGTLTQQKRHVQAMELRISVTKKAQETLPSNHPFISELEQTLAWAYMEENQMVDAERLIIKVLEDMKRKLGENDVDTLMQMERLAEVYQRQGRHVDAEMLRVHILAGRKVKLGEDHEETINAMGKLAESYHSLEKYVDEEPLRRNSMTWSRQHLKAGNSMHLEILADLATCYYWLERYSEAEVLYLENYNTRLQMGNESVGMAWTQYNLAYSYLKLGRDEEARHFAVKAEAMFRKVAGINHQLYRDCIRDFGEDGLYPLPQTQVSSDE